MPIQQEPWAKYRYRPIPRWGPIPQEVWEQREMRWALAHRDIAAVYKILRKFGVPQRRIAAATQQAQGEVSEIIAGQAGGQLVRRARTHRRGLRHPSRLDGARRGPTAA